MQLPPIPSPGSPITRAWAETLVNYLRSITPHSSPSQRLSLGGPGGIAFAGPATTPARQPGGILRPWRMVQASSLALDVEDGVLVHFDLGSLSTHHTLLSASALALSASSTNLIYAKLTLTQETFEGVQKLYQLTASVIEKHTSAPTGTWNPTTATNGTVFYKLGEVVTDDTKITSIEPEVYYPLVVLPTVMLHLSNPGTPTDDAWILSHNGTASSWLSAKNRDCT